MRSYLRLIAAGLFVAALIAPIQLAAVRYDREDLFGIHSAVIADLLSARARKNEFPTQLQLSFEDGKRDIDVHYSFMPHMQQALQDLYQHYRPDYATFVAMDVDSGAVVAMMNYIKDESDLGNLALRANYPAASVFKIVTAAAALDHGKATADTIVPYNGRRSTLYKSQVLRHRDGKWTRRPTLRTAFAESINPVFGRIGVFDLGAPLLNDYAKRFGFNTDLSYDLQIPISTSQPSDDTWEIAETASGYTERNTLSPLHGAMIASTAINDGRMRLPYVVAKMTGKNGVMLYAAEPREEVVMQPSAAQEMRLLMQETVTRGSARNAFRKFYRGPLADIEVGGKTGSLTGWSPEGRHDWFVGYASLYDHKIAFAALTINKKYWTVKSSFVARKAIEAYFSEQTSSLAGKGSG